MLITASCEDYFIKAYNAVSPVIFVHWIRKTY